MDQRLARVRVVMMLIQRLRRSVPSCLSRCRSAGGTWTTTTSATGMPSLDSEPPSSSRRHYLAMGSDGPRGVAGGSVSRQRLLTSDYESSDSPSSSEHGEQVVQRSSSAERRRDTVPDTTDDADHDASPSPSPSPSFHVEFVRNQVPHCHLLSLYQIFLLIFMPPHRPEALCIRAVGEPVSR